MKGNKRKDLIIMMPIFNDWLSFQELLQKIIQLDIRSKVNSLSVVIINDGSYLKKPLLEIHDSTLNIFVVNLSRNVGHQKAIAVGLAYINEEMKPDGVVVMDSDGEDMPEDIGRLLEAAEKNPDKIIFAHRSKRQESWWFIFFYKIYKSIFRLLTGKQISFGNFSIVPGNLLKRLVHVSEIWNHFSGGVIRSKIPYTTLSTVRGKRLAGESKMNLYSLVLHGLSAVSVHIDIVAVRLLIFSILLIFASFMGILVVISIRLFTDLAIPGWATSVIIGFGVIIMQAFLVSLLMVFIVLTYRTQKHFIPALDYRDFIVYVEEI